MLSIQVNVNDAGARAGIAAIIRACEDRSGMHLEMAQSVETLSQEHLLALNSRSPHTSFYGRAARSTEVAADGAGAIVTFTHRGLALRYYGGRVLPKTAKNLAIPTENVPLAGAEGRKRPREMGILAWLPASKTAAAGTTGYLVEGVEITGKRSGKTRVVPKKDGRLMYVLRSWTDHPADPSVLPTIAALIATARDAAATYLENLPSSPPA